MGNVMCEKENVLVLQDIVVSFGFFKWLLWFKFGINVMNQSLQLIVFFDLVFVLMFFRVKEFKVFEFEQVVVVE